MAGAKLCEDLTLAHMDSFFQSGPAVELKTIPRSILNGRPLNPKTGGPAEPKKQPFVAHYKRRPRANNPQQTAYASDYQDEENRSLTEGGKSVGARSETSSVTGIMSRVDIDSTITGMSQVTMPEGMTEDNAVSVYNNYDFKPKQDTKLSIAKYREKILRTVENYPATVIQGETGSGKTTQVAQYILEDHARLGHYCNIIVTQPRKIAAISICKRVCAERQWAVGSVCGYQVGMDKVASEDTRLLYCTTGILLNKLIAQKNMREYTHVILDEIHERDQHSDFCLLIVRKLLRSNSTGVKVVLMSATIDAHLFANYFSVPMGDKLSPAPVVKVEGRTFNVQEYYLDNMTKRLHLNIPDMRHLNPMISVELYQLALKLIDNFDEMEAEIDGEHEKGISKNRGSVLVFLPGIHEINEFDELLNPKMKERRYIIIPLHSTLTGDEQSKVFHKPGAGDRKIILSTNIAESSITVPDIKYVIDFCLTKNLECDQDTNYSQLKLQWASKANCKQRKGRAGRVANGRVYRMVSTDFYDSLQDYTTPEMQRCPLDSLILQVKLLDLGEPKAILGLALSPPNLDDIERTILVLKEVGALSTIRDGGENIHDGDLTFMGRVLASLPVDIRLGKLILLGYVFGCLSDCIIIAASLAVRTFFAQPFKSAFEAYRFKLSWSGNPLSDSIALLNAYTVWNTKTSTGYFRTTTEEARWGRDNFLQIRRLKEVRDLVEELEKRLHKHNIVTPRQPANQRHQGPMDEKTKQEKWLILKVVMCGAFYPNFFTPSHIDEEQAIRDLSGKNPATTVWVKGLPSNAGHMYKSQIQNLFHVCDQAASRPKVHFEQSRAYIEFQRDPSIARHHSCRVLPAVYFALKLRLIKTDLTVEIVHNHEEEVASSTDARNPETAKNKNALKSPWNEGEHGDGQSQEPRHVPRPTPNQTVVPVYVTEVISPDSFWVYFADPFTWEALRKQQEKIAKELDTYESLPAGRVRVSTYCLAPYIDDGMCYYRARIHSIGDRNRGGNIVKVFFLDYGNVDTCSAADLKVIPKEIFELPFQAVSCSLAQLKPSPLKCPNGEWTKEAIECFRSKVQAKRDLRAKIYSIVDECLRVELFETPNGQRQIDINQELIDLRYALKADESFISKMSNRQRDEEALLYHAPSEQHIGNGDGKANNLKQAVEKKQRETAEFGVTKKGHKVVLAGPWSPLEVSVHSMAHIGRLKQSRIEQDSLNCVLLDEEPQLKCTSLVVAAHVSLSQSGTEMRLRQTTVMPKIPGLPALVAMLFAPKAELRTDDTYSAYTGVLCGLGYDEENDGPALPDHDMEINFDTEFDREDLSIINKVRVAVNLALEPESQHVAELDESSLLNIQRQSCQLLLQLLQRERKAVDIKPTCYSGEWNVVDPDRVLAPMMTDMLHVLYHLHNGIELAEDLEEEEDEEEAKEVYPPQSAGRGVGRGRGIVGQSAARNNNVPPPPVGYHSQQQGGGGYSQKSQMYNQPQYQNNGAYSQQQTQGREHNPPKQFRPSHSQPQQQNPRSQQNQQIPPRYQQQQQNQQIPPRYQQQQKNQQLPTRYQQQQQQNQQIPPRYQQQQQQQQNQQQWTQQQNQQFPRYQNQQQQHQQHSSFVAPGSQINNTRPAALSLQNAYTPSHNPPSQHMAPNYPPLSMRHQAPAAQRYPAAASMDNCSDSDSSGSYYSVGGRGKQRKKVANTQQPKKQTQPPPPSHLVTLEPPQLPPPPPQQQVSMAAVTPSAAAAPGINAAADAHIRELHRMANTSEEPWDVECKVCRKMTNSPKELMLHLQTRLHKMREDIIYGKK